MQGTEIPKPALMLSLALAIVSLVTRAQGRPLRPFTLAEEIHLTNFNHWSSGASPIMMSPNMRLVAVWAERGLLEQDRVQDELRVYDIAKLRTFVRNPRQWQAPAPILDLRESTYKEGPIIRDVQWLRDSTGLAFLLRGRQGKNQLAIIGLNQKGPRILSLKGQVVTEFDVRDATHYVYTVASVDTPLRPLWRDGRVAWDATGQSLINMLLPQEVKGRLIHGRGERSVLWAAVGGVPHRVLRHDGQPIVMFPVLSSILALSLDGHTLAAALPVGNVPESWMREFRPPYANDPLYAIHAGHQDLDATFGEEIVNEYVFIDLRTGTITPIEDAPTGIATGWYTLGGGLTWSDDGKALLLSDVYLQATHANAERVQPCVAVWSSAARIMRCLEPQPRFFIIKTLRFAYERSDEVILRYQPYDKSSYATEGEVAQRVFIRSPAGVWRVAGRTDISPASSKSSDLYVRQGLNEPPVVESRDPESKRSRVIWDPNPQLNHVALAAASVYQWSDPAGRKWTGGLYTPADYVAGRRYPLVIQTHGFPQSEFRPSGVYPTAFAARALAASGIIVLQSAYCPVAFTSKSGPCDVAGFAAAVRQLASQGLVDPNRVGIIGFSYTVYTALEALTTGPLRYAAASITGGWNYGYWEYLTSVDSEQDQYARSSDAMVGAKPFGAGLLLWLKRAPDFNLQNVQSPLLINSGGRFGLLGAMWEPYAALRYLHKPVDLVLLHSDEHVLTDPAVRLVSQGGSVDWFRFWLQGYESPHPVMPGEYGRWEQLCDMQIEQNPGRPTWCVPTKGFLAKHPDAVRPAAN